MATVEVAQPPVQVEGNVETSSMPVEEDLKVALSKGIGYEDDNEDQILFSCNICYDVSLPA